MLYDLQMSIAKNPIKSELENKRENWFLMIFYGQQCSKYFKYKQNIQDYSKCLPPCFIILKNGSFICNHHQTIKQ